MERAIASARGRDDCCSLYHTPSRDNIRVCSTIALGPSAYLFFSVAVVRARVLPRWCFWLIVLQIIGLASVFGTAIAFAAFLVFEGLFGLSIAGWGYAILSTRSRVESSERLTVH